MSILVFAMTKADLVEWTLYVIAVIAIVLVAGAIFTLGGSYLGPRIERIQKGLKAQPGEKPCCPPGAGCNDPSDSIKACRRMIAMENGSAEDLSAMERAWNYYHSLPKSRTKAKRKALLKFADIRDRIFFLKLSKDIKDSGGSRLPQLEAMSSEDEIAESEIVEPKST